MFNDQFQQPGRLSNNLSNHQETRKVHVLCFYQALNRFNRTVSKGKTRYLLLSILRRPPKLLHLSDLNLRVVSSSEIGLCVVLIDHIWGTQRRIRDFDFQFYPLSERLQDRWVNIATAHLEGINLPAVELIQVGGKYFVRDGHHRISVAKAFGQEEIDARITLWKI